MRPRRRVRFVTMMAMAATMMSVVICLGLVVRPQAPTQTPTPTQTSTPTGAPTPTVATSPTGAPAPAEVKPIRVTIGLFVTSIPNVDIKSGTFTVDMYLWMVHPGSEAAESFEIANEEIQSKELLERSQIGAQTYICWRVKATMHAHLLLTDYPFDRQTLGIHFENTLLEAGDLVYVPDLASYRRSATEERRWGLKEGVEILEYEVIGTRWHVEDSVYATDFGKPTDEKPVSVFSNAIFDIEVARSFWPYCYKILIPLSVIIAIAYLVFFLPPEELEVAVGLAMTSLLTCVAMNITVSGNLPEVGYLVASDKFFICTYALIFVTLCETVWTYRLAKANRHALAARIETIFRWGFPVGFIGAYAVLAVQALT